jgi:hypothetical protein
VKHDLEQKQPDNRSHPCTSSIHTINPSTGTHSKKHSIASIHPINDSLVVPSIPKERRYSHSDAGGADPCESTPIEFVAETLLPTKLGSYRVRAYRDLSIRGIENHREIIVIIWGDVSNQPIVPIRVHDQCFTSEVLGSLKCDCREQLDVAMKYIQDNIYNCGMVIYLHQEGQNKKIFKNIYIGLIMFI